MTTLAELKGLDGEEIVKRVVKEKLSAAIDFNTPFAKFALEQIGSEAIGYLLINGWKPPV